MFTDKTLPILMETRTAAFPGIALFLGATILLLGSVLSGCANRSLTRYDAFAKEIKSPDYSQLAQSIRKKKKLYPSRDDFLYRLDLGVAYHYAGKFDSSTIHLLKAVDILDGLYARSVTNEAVSLVTNDNIRPYRGRPFEVVLMHQFLAWNFLALGKVDASLVETRRAQLLFNEWEKKNGDSGKFHDIGLFHYMSSLAYAAGGERDNAMISLFKSVQAYREAGRLPESVKNAARTQLKAAGRESDLELLGLKSDETPDRPDQIPETYDAAEIVLVGFAGHAPVLRETVFWGTWVKDGMLIYHYRNPQGDTVTQVLPAPGLPPSEAQKARQGRKTRSGTTFHVKFAMPSMKTVPSRSAYFTARLEGKETAFRSDELADTERMLERYLEESRTAMLTRTVIRVVLRTIAQEKTKSELASANPLLNLVVSLGTDALADQLEQADTRNSFLLPRSVQVIRIPVAPGKHRVEAQARGRSGETVATQSFETEVSAGEKKFLFFPSLQ